MRRDAARALEKSLICGSAPAFSGQNLMMASRMESRWNFAQSISCPLKCEMVVPFTSCATCASISRGEVHHVVVVGVGHVELEHGELGVVLRRDAFVAEVAVDLVDAVHAADHQPLQVKLGRDAQVEVDVERVVVRDERLGHRAAGDGMHHRRLDFDEAVAVEKAPQRLHDLRALDEDLAHFGIHRQVDVAAAIARLHILQAVPLLGQREQVLHQEGDLFDVDA